ncbi:MAG: iron-containing alcohol dehydrogenase [Caldilineaceae bacterium]|nr:iron-containing alcohol dehydrogenase [Caldilineaceae bacterium]
MWYFRSPQIVFGEDSLEELGHLGATRALIVTDAVLRELGLTDQVTAHLSVDAIKVFADVEPEPSLQTTQRGADIACAFNPDLILAVGGGSVIDAAKAIVLLYENPGIDLEGIMPWMELAPQKARFVAVPTTSGTGSEATMGAVLTDIASKRKVTGVHPRLLPELAIVDPAMTRKLPPAITAATGMDVLTHAVDAYGSTYANDFADACALKAVELVFTYLPRAVADGATDLEAREHMANAAAIAGLAINTSNISLAHALGHSFGAFFKKPHGMVVGLFLPYTVEYNLNADPGRYVDLARVARLTDSHDGAEGGRALVAAIRTLAAEIGQPTSIAALGIDAADFAAALDTLCDNAVSDMSIISSQRPVDMDELRRLFEYAYAGKPIDF